MAGSACSPAALLERFVQIRLGFFEGRCKSEKNSGQQREASSEDQHAKVESYLLGARQRGRQHSHRCACSPGREQQTHSSACKSEKNALCKQLADDASLACAQCRANCKFASPLAGASQQQISDVYARNHEHKANRGQKHEQQRPDTSSHLFLERPQLRADAFICVRKGFGETARHSVHVGACLFDGHAGLEPADTMESQPGASFQQYRIAPLADGGIDLTVVEAGNRQMKIGGNDSDDGVVSSVQCDVLSQNVGRRAELALP